MDKNSTLFKALYRLCLPLARMLLRNAVPYKLATDILKTAYVHSAEKDFTVDGRKQTDSRIATITGLTRKDVARLRQQGPQPPQLAMDSYHRPARVIWGWTHEQDFLDAQGKPLPLPLEGEHSFAELVRRFSGDMPYRAMLDELTRVGIVEQQQNQLYLISDSYIPKNSQTAKLGFLGSDVAGLIATMDRNIYQPEHSPYFQRKVYYDNIPLEALEPIHEQLSSDGQQLLEKADQFMQQFDRDINPKAKGTGRKAIGLGIYFFEETIPEDKDNG